MSAENKNVCRIGIDIGGTFTDLVLYLNGSVRTEKVLTTPKDLSQGVLQGFQTILQQSGLSSQDVTHLIHGTTIAGNTLIQKKGAKTAFITTKGFRDILEMRRELRYDMYDLFLEFPRPLVPRYLCKGVTERINHQGEVIKTFDEEEFRCIMQNIIKEHGIESVAICFLHSYLHPKHEMRAQQILQEEFPQLEHSISSLVSGEIREYERSSTTVINAYIKPLVKKYLGQLSWNLKEEGFEGELYVMLSNGGICSLKTAQELPVRLIESGPAAGVIAANYFGQQAGEANLISFDMGGTTAKISLISEGKPSLTRQFEGARVHRLTKGSGYPINIPAIQLIEIGAGGGSIAKVDEMGLLKVGPESAGADPGPACYGLGGQDATVTDADLLLGYLNPNYFLGGQMELDVDAARKAMQRCAQELDMDPIRVAEGIFDLVNENMATAMKVYIAEMGKDPRKYLLITFGGAGPVHAYQIAHKLGFRKIICPLGEGVASATGLLVSQPALDFAISYVSGLEEIDWNSLNTIYEEMESSGREVLVSTGVDFSEIKYLRTADIRYSGQGFEIDSPIPLGKLARESLPIIENNFWKEYKRLYGRTVSDVSLEGVTWRTRALGPTPSFSMNMEELSKSKIKQSPFKGERKVYFPEYKDFVQTKIYDRYSLPAGLRGRGPAVIEEKESTTVVGPDADFYVDERLNIIINL